MPCSGGLVCQRSEKLKASIFMSSWLHFVNKNFGVNIKVMIMLVGINGNVARNQQLLRGYCEILNITRFPDVSRTLRVVT
jgi:hypothetical protein